jgi:hypothetical protein
VRPRRRRRWKGLRSSCTRWAATPAPAGTCSTSASVWRKTRTHLCHRLLPVFGTNHLRVCHQCAITTRASCVTWVSRLLRAFATQCLFCGAQAACRMHCWCCCQGFMFCLLHACIHRRCLLAGGTHIVAHNGITRVHTTDKPVCTQRTYLDCRLCRQ